MMIALHWVKVEGKDAGVHITKNPNFDPISTFSSFHYKKLGDPNFL